jgi:serine/threonine-protein kinase
MTPDPRGAVARPAMSLVGALVAGKYRLRRVIGRGGMGTVYKAENVAIGRTVAVKVLHAHLADDGVTVARFQREARAAASVGHEHIIEILDMGVEPNGAPFIVMEYVRGKSLADVLREGGRMEPERAARVAGQMLAGLAAAHRAGIIHRDLKPENVLLCTRQNRRDFVKLFDFGIATFVDAAQDSTGRDDLTPSGRAMGTPTYASPEQMMGNRVRDARIDLYAVGVLLFEMLAGRVPFTETRFPDLCRAITDRPPPSFAELGVGVPPALEAVVRRALSKAPAERFPTAEAMAEALVPFGAERIVPEAEPTDTLTMELRELRARERARTASEPPVAPAAVEMSGEAFAAVLAVIERVLGPETWAALTRAEPELVAALGKQESPDRWYPGGVLSLVERIDREHGRGDRRMLAEVGRHLAREAFAQRENDGLLRTLTPELFFSLLPELWVRYFGVGEARVVKVGRGYGRLEVVETAGASLARSVAIAGYLDEAIRMAGGRGVDVRLAASAALGDPLDVFEATWSS